MNRIRPLHLILCLAVLLAACGGDGDDSPALEALPTRTAAPTAALIATVEARAFEVISLHDQVDAFLVAAEDAPSLERIDLLNQHLIAQSNGCLSSELWPRFDPLSWLADDLVGLDLSYWRASVDTLPTETMIGQIATALGEAHELMPELPGPDAFRACLIPLSGPEFPEEAPNGGLGIFIPGPGQLVVTCTAGEFCLDRLMTDVAREYHYAYQIGLLEESGPDITLLDFSLIHARANHFTRQLYPDATFPWDAVDLDPAVEAEVWSRMSEWLGATYGVYPDYRYVDRFLWGTDDPERYPAWAGIIIGGHILQGYLDTHPDLTLADLAALPARTILDESGYPSGQPVT